MARRLFAHLATAFGISISILIVPTPTRAEIPFTHAKGMFEGTKDEYKHLSPFWGMVALHGRMLEQIRFFGNYRTEYTKNNQPFDVGNDSIAILIKDLFNSPDGVQFVPTTYANDPVGNLSRNLPRINDIIEVLINSQASPSLSPEKAPTLSKDEADRLIILDKNKRNLAAEIKNIKIEEYRKDIAPEEKLRIVEENTRKIEKKSELDQKLEQIKREINEISKKITPVKTLSKVSTEMPIQDRIFRILTDISPPLDTLNSDKIYEFARKNVRRQMRAGDTRKREREGAAAEQEEPDLGTIVDFENRIDQEIQILSKGNLEKLAEEEIEKTNMDFAYRLVSAFKQQEVLANPKNPKQQLYPENIVITALLTFFMKVADHKSDLKNLPFLMKEDFDAESTFTKDEYFQNKEQGMQHLTEIVHDQKNPELSFFMAKGYNTYESPFAEPINYRSDTCYKTPEGFPDCGETSWRNVLTLFLSAKKGGLVDQESVDTLERNLVKLNPGLDLNAQQRFQLMIKFFEDYPNITSAATQKAHSAWAQIVSDLNDRRKPQSLDDVQYGNQVGEQGNNVYEIKSAVHEDVKGIISMFNVIAKLIPDQILNTPWNPDRQKRLEQVAEKLNRLCILLSRDDLEISWENKETEDQTINNEFMVVTFTANEVPVFGWRFVQGHFQLDPIANHQDDWRLAFDQYREFQNDWMASLYLKLNEDKCLEDETYGERFPLVLLYNANLQSLDGSLKALSFILFRGQEQAALSAFYPLMARWIQKSIPLTDPHSLEKISILLFGVQDQQSVKDILKNKRFAAIPKKIEEITNNPKITPLQFAVQKNLRIELILIVKNFPEYSDLNLTSNDTITDTVLKHLVNLNSLYLYLNNKITDEGLKHLVNLNRLSLFSNNRITDEGLKSLRNLNSLVLVNNHNITDAGLQSLVNLTTLNLSYNDKITNEGLQPLVNLTNLELNSNGNITDEGLQPLVKLTHLDLHSNHNITDEGLQPLVNLKNLNLESKNRITDKGLKTLVNLENLTLQLNSGITDIGLETLVSLKNLDLGYNDKITDAGLQSLVNLTNLNLSSNGKITDEGLKPLVKLTNLILSHNDKITDIGLKHLVNLTNLDLYGNKKITDSGLQSLVNLTNLTLSHNDKITIAGLQSLVNLKSLDLSSNNKITLQDRRKLMSINPNINIKPNINLKWLG